MDGRQNSSALKSSSTSHTISFSRERNISDEPYTTSINLRESAMRKADRSCSVPASKADAHQLRERGQNSSSFRAYSRMVPPETPRKAVRLASNPVSGRSSDGDYVSWLSSPSDRSGSASKNGENSSSRSRQKLATKLKTISNSQDVQELSATTPLRDPLAELSAKFNTNDGPPNATCPEAENIGTSPGLKRVRRTESENPVAKRSATINGQPTSLPAFFSAKIDRKFFMSKVHKPSGPASLDVSLFNQHGKPKLARGSARDIGSPLELSAANNHNASPVDEEHSIELGRSFTAKTTGGSFCTTPASAGRGLSLVTDEEFEDLMMTSDSDGATAEHETVHHDPNPPARVPDLCDNIQQQQQQLTNQELENLLASSPIDPTSDPPIGLQAHITTSHQTYVDPFAALMASDSDTDNDIEAPLDPSTKPLSESPSLNSSENLGGIASAANGLKLFPDTAVWRFQICEVSRSESFAVDLGLVDAQNQRHSVKVSDRWAEFRYEVGQIIHLVQTDQTGTSISLSKPWQVPSVVNMSQNFIIVRPDIMVSSTEVTGSISCMRKVVLQKRMWFAGGVSTKAIVLGTLAHEMFQESLKVKDFTQQFMQSNASSLVEKHIEEITLAEESSESVLEELMAKIPMMQRWNSLFVGNGEEKNAPVLDPANRGGTMTSVSIQNVVDIEEEVWCPILGIKGFIDATVEIKLYNNGYKGHFLVPLEMKTAKREQNIEHRGQTMLYSLMLSEKFGLHVDCGILYYSESCNMHRILGTRAELCHLICTRNELTHFINDQATLPAPLGSFDKICEYCPHQDVCVATYKMQEMDEKVEPLHPSFDDIALRNSGLTPAHKDFLRKWDKLLVLESNDAEKLRKEIWHMSSSERENVGRCIGDLEIIKTETISDNYYQYTLRAKEDPTPTQNLLDRSQAPGLYESGARLVTGDPIVISDDQGHVCLARGYLMAVHENNTIVVQTSKRIEQALLPMPGYEPNKRQMLASQLSRWRTRKSAGPTRRYRLDQNLWVMGMQLARGNLHGLFVHGGDPDRRRLIVDLEEPQFGSSETQCREVDKTFLHLNDDQRNALKLSLAAKDYALILGMPGTGKTATIASLAVYLISIGQSIFISSYTHSAVDNILMKILEIAPHTPMARIGRRQSVHPAIQHLCPDQARTQKDLADMYMTPLIVAGTCLSVQNWLFSLRRFDYCIIDEASQVSLPICLGPIRVANKFILVGDHHQLPPLVLNEKAAQGGLDVSLFERLCTAHPKAVANLRFQYRMNQDIMSLANHVIYDGMLRCGSSSVGNQKLQLDASKVDPWITEVGSKKNHNWLAQVLQESCSVAFLNTDDTSAAESNIGQRVQNETEAEIVRMLVEAFRECGVDDKDVGVISVYRQQLRLLQSVIQDHGKIEILTADRAQGRDKQCIIISLVRSNSRSAVGELLKDWRRLNVSFTRAKRKLIIVGSKTTLSCSDRLREFIELMSDNNWILDLPPNATECYRVPSRLKRSLTQSQPSSVKSARLVRASPQALIKNKLVLPDIAREIQED